MSNIKPRHIKNDTPLDRILKAWINHELDNLDEIDKNILIRITELDKHMQAGKLIKGNKNDFSRPFRTRELAEWHVERFKVSLRQAYVDIEMAKQFFLSTETRDDKEFARGQMIKVGLDMLDDARKSGDLKAATAIFKEISSLRGLDKIDVDTPDISNWEPVQPTIVADPSELGFEKIEHPDQVVKKLLQSFKQSPIEKILDDEEIMGDI